MKTWVPSHILVERFSLDLEEKSVIKEIKSFLFFGILLSVSIGDTVTTFTSLHPLWCDSNPITNSGTYFVSGELAVQPISRLSVLASQSPVKTNISRKQIILQVVIKILNGSQLCAFG